MTILRGLLLLPLLLLGTPVAAVIETYEFSDAALQERYQELSAELRCPKCQNQNIADSNAPIAQDLRRSLVQQLEQGASDEEILDYMVARYGEFVRYRPRFAGATLWLWLFPLLILALGVLVLVYNLRSRPDSEPATGGLSAEERDKLARMLDDDAPGDAAPGATSPGDASPGDRP